MALLELKGYGLTQGATRLAGVDLTVEPGTMLAVIGRGDGAISLLALAIAGLLPRDAKSEGTLSVSGKRVLYLDRNADAAALTEADLIVADEPGRARDPATQLALLSALRKASRTAAIIIFTADFRLALSMGLEVAVIANGKLLLKAPAGQIFELPQYDTVRNLVGGQRLRTRTLMRPPIGEPILELDGVARSFTQGPPWLGPPPVTVLQDISFVVREGEVVGLMGDGGAGKSTLLRLVAELDQPSAGRISPRPGLVGYVFADPRKAFNPTLPVGVSLTEPLRVEQTLLLEEQADRLVEVVRAVGLEPELLTRLPGELGTADLQRMALARALAGRPSLLLLDDPTSTLDPAETREFLVLFARVRADFGLTALVASREFEVLRPLADRLLVIEAGHIVEGGKPGELADAPKQEITRRLVSLRYPGPARFEAPPSVQPEPEPVRPTEETPPGPAATEPISSAAPIDQPSPQREPGPAEERPAPVLAPDAESSRPTPPPEPVPEPVNTLSAEIVIAPLVLPDPLPVAPDAAATATPPVEPKPATELSPERSADGADEAAEARKAKDAADGLVDAAGSANAADGEAGR